MYQSSELSAVYDFIYDFCTNYEIHLTGARQLTFYSYGDSFSSFLFRSIPEFAQYYVSAFPFMVHITFPMCIADYVITMFNPEQVINDFVK